MSSFGIIVPFFFKVMLKSWHW